MMKRQAYNPFLPLDTYIPDGEPHVFGDRVYLFGSHDKEGGQSFCMLDYEVWSAPVDDLAGWTSAGVVYSARQDPLSDENRPYLYAPDVVQGNDGRFYLYYCLAGWKGKGGYNGPIGVAVCDQPDGRYEYLGYVRKADGTPYDRFVPFDPAVLNDEGTIRLYFGTALPMGLSITRWNRRIMGPILQNIYGPPASAFVSLPGPLGANMAVLAQDMLTVEGEVARILPADAKGAGFAGHAFFEGASMRKVGDTYYFIYSSQNNHELCYATSKMPDGGFTYGGTIISNGDIGYEARKPRHRLNATGTTHGSIEQINGQWYVFYHRLTHGSDYSRQACAEPIRISPEGTIAQVEMTSCGLNGGPLRAAGTYPAAIACVLTNGHMPHIANRQWKRRIPRVTHEGECRYVADLDSRCVVGYKWFGFAGTEASLSVAIRGTGQGSFWAFADFEGKRPLACFKVTPSAGWQTLCAPLDAAAGAFPLYFRFRGRGKIDFLEFSFSVTKESI